MLSSSKNIYQACCRPQRHGGRWRCGSRLGRSPALLALWLADETDLGQAGLAGIGQGLGHRAVGDGLVGTQMDLWLDLLLAFGHEAVGRLGARHRLAVPETLAGRLERPGEL